MVLITIKAMVAMEPELATTVEANWGFGALIGHEGHNAGDCVGVHPG